MQLSVEDRLQPLAILDVPLEIFVVVHGAYQVYQFFVHTRFVPALGPLDAFARMVIEQAAANLLRTRRAGQRTPPRRPGPPAPPEEVLERRG